MLGPLLMRLLLLLQAHQAAAPLPVVWHAGAAHLAFDPATAVAQLLLSATSKPSDIGVSGGGCSSSGGAASIFGVRVWRTQGQPFGTAGWSEDDSVHLHPREWQWDSARSNGTAFVYVHNASGLEATLHAAGSDDAQRGLALTLALQNTGQATVYVAELTFPRLCGIHAPADAELVWGGGLRGTGTRTAEAMRNIAAAQLRWFEFGFWPFLSSDSWPHASMNWVALASRTTALYMGVHDAQMAVTAMHATAAEANVSINLALTANATVALPSGATAPAHTRSVVISVAQEPENTTFAQWHAASQVYAAWLQSVLPVLKHPNFLRQGFVGLDISSDYPVQYYGERETEIDVPWVTGLELVNVWGHSADPQCCPGYPVPDPGRGGAAGLRAYVERLQSAGLRVGTYFESLSSNPVWSNATSVRGIAVSSLPADQRPPKLDDLLAHTAMVDPGWNLNHGGNLDPGPTGKYGQLPGHYPQMVALVDAQVGNFSDFARYWAASHNGTDYHVLLPMHYGADGFWARHLRHWQGLYGGETIGTDAPYLDQLGFFPSGPDFARSGMLADGWGDGNSPKRIVDWLAKTVPPAYPRQQTSTDTSFFFTFEGYTDVYGALGGGALLSGHREIPCDRICDDVSPLMEARCAMCTTQMPWLGDNMTGVVSAWEVPRSTFPSHAIFEGTCNVGIGTALATHTFGAGFTDGHRVDLTSFGAASTLGFLTPIIHLREAVAPWLDTRTQYRYDEGVVAAPRGWTVRQHRAPSSFALFLCHSLSGAGGSLTLEVPASLATTSTRWFVMESTGIAKTLACNGESRCEVNVFGDSPPAGPSAAVAAVAAVLVVRGDPATPLPSNSLLLLRMVLQPSGQPALALSAINVGATDLKLLIPANEWSVPPFQKMAVKVVLRATVPAGGVAQVQEAVDMTGRELPAKLEVDVPGAAAMTRRLAPVPIADPHFVHRRYASGNLLHPDASSASKYAMHVAAVGGRTTTAYRHIYWPEGKAGVVHIRMKASTIGLQNLTVPMEAGVKATSELWQKVCVFFPTPTDGWAVGSLPFVGVANTSWSALEISVAGGPLQVPGLLQRQASLNIDRIEVLPPGVRPSWQGGEKVLPPAQCTGPPSATVATIKTDDTTAGRVHEPPRDAYVEIHVDPSRHGATKVMPTVVGKADGSAERPFASVHDTLSSVATGKRAIFWRGDLVAFNSTAAADVIRHGFTHTVVKLANQSQWLCDYQQSALHPLLDVSPHNKHLASLRSFSPWTQGAELQVANASLLKMLEDVPCVHGIVDDIEQLPFPTVMYKQTGEVDSYHSNTFSGLAQMIGDDSSPSQLSSLWPTFRKLAEAWGP